MRPIKEPRVADKPGEAEPLRVLSDLAIKLRREERTRRKAEEKLLAADLGDPSDVESALQNVFDDEQYNGEGGIATLEQLPSSSLDEQHGAAIIDGRTPKVNEERIAASYVWKRRIIYTSSGFYGYDRTTGLWNSMTTPSVTKGISREFKSVIEANRCGELLASRTSSKLRSIAQHAKGIAEAPGAFERRYPVIHLANGMLLLKGNVPTLKQFAPGWYSRNRSAIRWDPEARCPRFLEQLLRPALSEDDIALFQRYFGQCLLGRNMSQKILVCHGEGGEGKTTVSNIVERIIGIANVTELRTEQLGTRFELGQYCGHTLLIGRDVKSNFLSNVGAHRLKSLVGGDTVAAEFKNENGMVKLRGEFNIIITTNSDLRVRLDSDQKAWARRLIFMPFQSNAPAQPIEDFADLLIREEGEGILRWAVEGAMALLRDRRDGGGVSLTAAQEARVAVALGHSHTISLFVETRVRPESHCAVTTAEAMSAYVEFCNNLGHTPETERTFYMHLAKVISERYGIKKSHDIVRGESQVRGYRGITLVYNAEQRSPLHVMTQAPADASDGFSQLYDGRKSDSTDLLGGQKESSETSVLLPQDVSDDF